MGQQIFQGIAESVDPDGGLLLRQNNGNLIKIVAGDVTLKTNGDIHPLIQDLPPE